MEQDLNRVFQVAFQTKIPGLEAYNIGHMFEPLTVHITAASRREFAVSVQSGDFIHDLKRKIALLEGIPANYQRIYYQGQELYSDSLLSAYRLKNHSYLTLSIASILEIRVTNMLLSLYFAFNISKSAPVSELKALIRAKEGIDIDHQILVFKGLELLDDLRLEDYDLKSQDFVELLLREEDKMQVFIWKEGEKRFKVEVSGEETGKEVISDLQRSGKVQNNDFYLVFKGEILEKDRPLSSYQIRQNAVLRLIPSLQPRRNLQIYGSNGLDIALNLPESAPILVLKQLLAQQELLPVTSLLLFYGEKLLDEESTVGSYHFPRKAALQLYHKTCQHTLVVLLPSQRQLRVVIDDFDTIHRIKEIVAEYEGIPIETQRLLVSGALLEDDEIYKNLNSTSGAEFQLALAPVREFEIVIKLLGRQQLTWALPNTTSVVQIKRRIWEHFEIPKEAQRLYYANREIEDRFTLAYYQVQSGATLYLIKEVR